MEAASIIEGIAKLSSLRRAKALVRTAYPTALMQASIVGAKLVSYRPLSVATQFIEETQFLLPRLFDAMQGEAYHHF